MFLDEFHASAGDVVRINAEQGSRFAKEVADDFNPIHDTDSKRFCVPGDLLFSLVLARHGLSEHMHFRFTGMVDAGDGLLFPPTEDEQFSVDDEAGKTYLEVERSGAITRDAAAIESMVKGYVAFSGRNFPHVLVPLMAEHGVMINPDRPLVIYERMSFDLEPGCLSEQGSHCVSGLTLEAASNELEVKGKRGEAHLHFDIKAGDERVGSGFKKLLLSGLRPFEADAMEALSETYMGWKAAYKKS